MKHSSHPARPRVDISALPHLDSLQLGHVQHLLRLAAQPPGDWTLMGNFEGTQEGDDALRYQLAHLVYTLATAQYHHTPAYRQPYRTAIRELITKMLRHEVWAYWELTSRGGNVIDPDLTELREGWVDPVAKQNVMYSGHLLTMVGLAAMLYRDGFYDKPGSITFKFRPLFRGLGVEDFVYDHRRLANAVHREFASNSFLGCQCEPNGIFVYCNQFALLGLWLDDLIHGGDRSIEARDRFADAWSSRSNLFHRMPDPTLPFFYMVRQQMVVGEAELKN
jgi:hypothetical protein